MEERCARTHPIFVADLHDARDGGNTNGKCVHKEDVQRGRVRQSRLAFREKHDTTLEAAALRPLAIYGNGSVNGAWSRSCFTISFSRGKGRSRYVFFSFIKDRQTGGGRQRVARGQGVRDRMVLFYFGQGRLFEHAPLRGKLYATSTVRKAETIFILFPRRLVFTSVPSRCTGRHRRPAVVERRRMCDGGDLSPSEVQFF